MRLHLDNDRHEARFCLALVIAVMILSGSAILYMGAQYRAGPHVMARVLLPAPL